jgi:hypothetical protein
MAAVYAAARKIASGKKSARFAAESPSSGLAGDDATTLLTISPEKSVKILLSLRSLTLLE